LSDEVNDNVTMAATTGVNDTISGVIDNPFDQDYYTFTVTEPMIMSMSKNIANYQVAILSADSNSNVYKISQKEEMYQFDAGTYYLLLYSTDGIYDANKTYGITLNKIADIADDDSSCCYMVNEPAKIVFQSDSNGNNMYVNGNEIDVSYKYYLNASNSYGLQVYDLVMENSESLRAKIYQDEFMFDDPELTAYFGMAMPDTVYYLGGTKGVGAKGNVLELSLYTIDQSGFYRIHCACTGAYQDDYMHQDLFFSRVYIDPNTGKLVDIAHINYFYDHASGANSMTSTRPYINYTKYYYPYADGNNPTSW